MIHNDELQKNIRTQLEQAKTIAIFGHVNPDGDAIGSMLGLGSLLEKQGKYVRYFTPTAPSYIYDDIKEANKESKKIETEFDHGQYDLLVILDLSEYCRLEQFYEGHEAYFETSNVVVIDHHITKEDHPKHLIRRDPSSMSTCELVFELTYPRRPEFYDKNIAGYLYLGLTTDSGNFRYDEDHERILNNALNLIKLGADKKEIINNVFRRKSFNGVKMMARMFDRLTLTNKLAYTRYSDTDLAEFGIDREEADFGQIIIQDITEADITMICREENGTRFKGSLRSKYCNVEKITKHFGGGGHLHAAGFSLPREGSFEEQIQKVTEVIIGMMQSEDLFE